MNPHPLSQNKTASQKSYIHPLEYRCAWKPVLKSSIYYYYNICAYVIWKIDLNQSVMICMFE